MARLLNRADTEPCSSVVPRYGIAAMQYPPASRLPGKSVVKTPARVERSREYNVRFHTVHESREPTTHIPHGHDQAHGRRHSTQQTRPGRRSRFRCFCRRALAGVRLDSGVSHVVGQSHNFAPQGGIVRCGIVCRASKPANCSNHMPSIAQEVLHNWTYLAVIVVNGDYE